MLTKEEIERLRKAQHERHMEWDRVRKCVKAGKPTDGLDREMVQAAFAIKDVYNVLRDIPEDDWEVWASKEYARRILSSLNALETRQVRAETRASSISQLLPELNDELKILGFRLPYINIEVTA